MIESKSYGKSYVSNAFYREILFLHLVFFIFFFSNYCFWSFLSSSSVVVTCDFCKYVLPSIAKIEKYSIAPDIGVAVYLMAWGGAFLAIPFAFLFKSSFVDGFNKGLKFVIVIVAASLIVFFAISAGATPGGGYYDLPINKSNASIFYGVFRRDESVVFSASICFFLTFPSFFYFTRIVFIFFKNI